MLVKDIIYPLFSIFCKQSRIIQYQKSPLPPVSQSTEPLSWVSLMGTRKVLSLINVSRSVHPKFYDCSNDLYFILFGSRNLQFQYWTVWPFKIHWNFSVKGSACSNLFFSNGQILTLPLNPRKDRIMKLTIHVPVTIMSQTRFLTLSISKTRFFKIE